MRAVDWVDNLSKGGFRETLACVCLLFRRLLALIDFLSKVTVCSLSVPPPLSPLLLRRKRRTATEFCKISLTILKLVRELSLTLRDVRSAPPRFYTSPSPVIARFREPIQLSST